MSNSVFQNVIVQLKDISERTFGVIDTDGCVISCTDVALLGERWPEAAVKAAGSTDAPVQFNQKYFRAIFSATGTFEYAVFCTGTDENAMDALNKSTKVLFTKCFILISFL